MVALEKNLLIAFIFGVVFCIFQASAQTTYLKELAAKYDHQHYYDNGGKPFLLFWSGDTTNNVVKYAVAVENNIGWVAAGYNVDGEAGMITASVVRAFKNGTNTVDFDQRVTGSDTVDPFRQASLVATETFTSPNGTIIGKWMIAQFVLPLANLQANSVQNLVFSSRETDTDPKYHDYGRNYLDFINILTGSQSGPENARLDIPFCNPSLCKAPNGACIETEPIDCDCNDGYLGENCLLDAGNVPLACQVDETFYDKSVTFFNGHKWYYHLNSNDTISVAVNGSTTGWVGWGVGKEPGQMVGSEAVIGWIDSNQVQHVNSFVLNAKEASQILPNDANIPLSFTSACQFGSYTVIKFTRSLSAGNNRLNIDGKQTNIVTSYGPADYIQGNSNNFHGSNKSPGTIDLLTGQSSVLGPDALRVAHGILMFLGWGVFLQFGAMWARYAKKTGAINKDDPQCTLGPIIEPGNPHWFWVHRLFQTLGYLCSTVGFIIALSMTAYPHFTNNLPHAALGLTTMILGFINISIAPFRPHPPDKSKGETEKRPIRIFWELKHWWVGRAALILAVITIFYGLDKITENDTTSKTQLLIAYGVVAGVEFLLYVILEISRCISPAEHDPKQCY